MPVGHFEKVTKDVQKYVYVDGFNPSGIKGSLVVSKGKSVGLDFEPRITNRYGNNN